MQSLLICQPPDEHDFLNWDKLVQLVDKLPKEYQEEFKATMIKGHLIACHSLQAVLDVSNITAWSMVTSVLIRSSGILHGHPYHNSGPAL